MAERKPAENDKLIEEMKRRFARCEDHESANRPLWVADLKFANADPDNGYQWSDGMRKQRETDKRPALTINKTKQHNRQITNEARQNKPAVRVSPVDDGADKDTAEVFNGIIRHIEANSSADTAYDMAAEFAVDAGLGYWRVTTDYADETSFDQEIYIKAVKNPLTIYLDPDIQEADGSDARFGFVFKDMPREEFEDKYPGAEAVSWPLSGGDDWLTKDTIRLVEYYKIIEKADTLCRDANSGETFLLSTIENAERAKAIKADPAFKKRAVQKRTCKWHLMAGDQVLEQTDWLGKYIPIVRVVGDEVEIEGKVERKGHTRPMKDAQRMYNYNSSASVEYGALQTKTPIIAAAESIEGYTEFWERANTENLPYLPYNAYDENGNAYPAPHRMTAPAPAQLFLQGMQTAAEEMKMASGQYDASMGARSNETSGRAIIARERQGDTATFHFPDNVNRAIKFTGKILVDLIPKVYDAPRVARILGEDGSADEAHLDPSQSQSMVETKDADGKIKKIYNLGVGRYDVTAIPGPSYGSKRAEAFQSLSEIASRSPDLMAKAGDLIMLAADFPMADKIAKRLAKALPPELRDEEGGAPPLPPQIKQQMQATEQHAQEMEKALQQLGEKYNALESKSDAAAEDRRIRAYQAHTARLAVIKDMLTPEMAMQLADEVGLDVLNAADLDTATEYLPGQDAPAEQAAPEAQQDPSSSGFDDAPILVNP